MKCRGHQCSKDATWRVTFGDGTSAVYCWPCASGLQQMAEGTFHTSIAIEKLRDDAEVILVPDPRSVR